MARLSKEEWQVARERWESDDRKSFDWLAEELKVSRPAVAKTAKNQGWSKVTNEPEKVTKSEIKVTKKVTESFQAVSELDLEKVTKVTQQSKGGRPTKYKPEYCQQIIDYFSNNDAYEILEHESDETRKKAFLNRPLTMAGFAQTIGVDRATLERWSSERDENGALVKPDFCRSYRAALTMQEKMIAEGGMAGIYNANIAKLMLTNHHGYVDVTVNKNEVHIPKETEEQLNRLYNLKMSKTKDVQDALEGRFERIVGELK